MPSTWSERLKLLAFAVLVLAVLLGGYLASTSTGEADPVATGPDSSTASALPTGETVPQQGDGTTGTPDPDTSQGTQGPRISLDAPLKDKDLAEAAQRTVEFLNVYLGYDWRDDPVQRSNRLDALSASANELNSASGSGGMFAQEEKQITRVRVISVAPSLLAARTVIFSVEVETITESTALKKPVEAVAVVSVSMVAEGGTWRATSLAVEGPGSGHSHSEGDSDTFQDGGTGG